MWYLNTFELQRTAHGALYCNCKWLRNITLLPSLIFACPENFLGVMKKTTKIVRVEEWTQGSGSKPEHPKYRAGFQIRVSRCCVKFIACWREAFETVTCKGMERQWRSCEQKCRRQSPPLLSPRNRITPSQPCDYPRRTLSCPCNHHLYLCVSACTAASDKYRPCSAQRTPHSTA